MSRKPPSAADRIAREAARLYETGEIDSIERAIRAAAESLGLHDCERPSVGRVRQHVQAMAMQSMGDVGYNASVAETLSSAEQLMSALSEMVDSVTPLLVGRAVRGQVDGPTHLHVRLYTDQPIDALAQALVDLGYDEPEFDTVTTRHGRLNRIHVDDDGVPLVLTRCPPSLRGDAGRNLFTGEPIPTATLDELRTLVRSYGDA